MCVTATYIMYYIEARCRIVEVKKSTSQVSKAVLHVSLSGFHLIVHAPCRANWWKQQQQCNTEQQKQKQPQRMRLI